MSNCSFPYYDNDGVCVTYASYIGKNYTDYHNIFITFSVIVFVATLLQLIRIFYYLHKTIFVMQRLIISLAMIMAIMLVIQSIDPYGYSDVLPIIIEKLVSNFAMCIGLVSIFIVIGSLLKITDELNWEKIKMISIITCLVIALTMILTFLQVYVNRSVFRGIKLILFSISCVTSTVYLNYIMRNIFMILKNNVNQRSSNNANIIEQQWCCTDPRKWLGAIPLRMVVYILLFDIYMFFTVISQIYVSITVFEISYGVPVLSYDMIVFPLCQLLGNLLIIMFTLRLPTIQTTVVPAPESNSVFVPEPSMSHIVKSDQGLSSVDNVQFNVSHESSVPV